MNALADECGLTKIKNLGTDFFITMSIVNNMTDEQFDARLEDLRQLEKETGFVLDVATILFSSRTFNVS